MHVGPIFPVRFPFVCIYFFAVFESAHLKLVLSLSVCSPVSCQLLLFRKKATIYFYLTDIFHSSRRFLAF